jgi:hypothetical protein
LVGARVPNEHAVYIDRYFTSIPLLDYLLERHIFPAGTILTGRIQRNLKLKLSIDKELLRKGRGTCDEFFRQDGKFVC